MSDQLKKVQIVGPVQTNTENPWRTQGDYRQEQRRATILFVVQIILLLVAIASVAITSYVSVETLNKTQRVVVEAVNISPHIAPRIEQNIQKNQ